MNTKEGAAKAQATIRKKYGVTPDGKSRMFATIGRLGGLVSRGGGFASMDKDKVREAGRKGGKASRRTKDK